MDSAESPVPIIRTKLHRPLVQGDFVVRNELNDRLEEGRNLPLTLVSAPAGFGKSTLISHWLETQAWPNAWLSLDESDNDLQVFLCYLIAAIRTVFPKACGETLARLKAGEVRSVEEIAGSLLNELDALTEHAVLALDDYHKIHDAAIHEFVDCLLRHPTRFLHLTIITRVDPPLSLGGMRAHGMMREIRLQELQFSESETATFIQKTAGLSLEHSDLARLHEHTEGWPVGLRLVAAALLGRKDVSDLLMGLAADTQHIQDYLMSEVLSNQSPSVRQALGRLSIFNRFCAPLCEAVGATEADQDGGTVDNSNLPQWLRDAGLPYVALDHRHEWYRFHHVVQELLKRQLRDQLAPEEIADLHRRAAGWYEAQGLLEEALHHVRQADGPGEAGRLIVRHRNEILNQEQWPRLHLWLRRLPDEIVNDDPELLVLKAWAMFNQGRYEDQFRLVDRIEAILNDPGTPQSPSDQLLGAIDTIRCHQRWIEGEGERSLELAERALSRLPSDCDSERALAHMVQAGARQMCGDLERGRQHLYDLLADTSASRGTFRTRLWMTLSFVNWMAADLPAMRRAGTQLLEIGDRLGLAESSLIGRYFVGVAQYHQNQLDEAETSLLPVVTGRTMPNVHYFMENAFALAAVYQAKGRAAEARATIESAWRRVNETVNTVMARRAETFQAELALRQGRLAEAGSWVRSFIPESFKSNPRFYEPVLTLVKVRLAQGGEEDLAHAGRLLEEWEQGCRRVHNLRYLIEALALQALLREAQGDETAALGLLSESVRLALPGGFIRLFADLGPGIPKLLNRLDLDEEGLGYIGRILAAFRNQAEILSEAGTESPAPEMAPSRGRPSLDPLTSRELQVLVLLAEHLTNKEIAARLYIAPGTVKRHTNTIYDKLAVHGRREAVAKARGLGIF